MDNETRERIISNEDRLMEEVNKQAKVIQWYEKENRHNQEIIIKDCKEIEELKRKIEIKDRWCQLIWDIGCDYDGYNDVDNLKKIIDELVEYSNYARTCDDITVVYSSLEGNKKYNILDEEIQEE